MPEFEKFSKEVQSQFQVRKEDAAYVHYPFNQAALLGMINSDSGGVWRVLSLVFANARFNDRPRNYEQTFGQYRTKIPDFMKRVDAMQRVAENRGFYTPSSVPLGANLVKLKTKRNKSIALNTISDLIAEIVSHRAVYYVSLRTGDDKSGHAIAFDTRGPMIMYDPNCGWWEVRNNPTAGGFFKSWFPKWYKEMGYKTDYHGGNRSFIATREISEPPARAAPGLPRLSFPESGSCSNSACGRFTTMDLLRQGASWQTASRLLPSRSST
jgi:hypothetical protein